MMMTQRLPRKKEIEKRLGRKIALDSKVTYDDLVPNAEQLRTVAYYSLAGDPAGEPVGTHSRLNLTREDSQGRSKLDTYQDAITGNLDPFTAIVASVKEVFQKRPFSHRYWLEKADGGQRPIDDAAESVRLLSSYARDQLADLFEAQLHGGQYGVQQPGWKSEYPCPRPGATQLDDLAHRMHQEIWIGYTHVLTIDLKDAFGTLPRKAVRTVLKDLGFSKRAIDYLWALAGIRATDSKTGTQYKSRTRGVEQGNPLSPILMSLALSQPLKDLEGQVGVKVLAYVDDIYILARTETDARAVFKLFTDKLKTLGFQNIRPLSESSANKASRIIDTTMNTVTVLKRYEVSKEGIGLTEKEVERLLAKLQKTELPLRGISLKTIRKKLGTHAVTKRSLKSQGIISRKKNGTSSLTTGRKEEVLVPLTIGTTGPLNYRGPEAQCPSSEGHGSTDRQTVKGSTGRSVGGRSPTLLEDSRSLNEEEVEVEAVKIPVPSLADIEEPPLDILDLLIVPSRGESSLLRSSSPSTLATLSPSLLSDSDFGSEVLQTNDSADDDVQASRRANSRQVRATAGSPGTAPTAGESAGTGEMEQADLSSAASSPVQLSISDPAIQAMLISGDLKFGTQFKPSSPGDYTVVDLVGLEKVMATFPQDWNLKQVVRSLLKAGRAFGRVDVRYDPRKPWTADPWLLGGHMDPDYKVEGKTIFGERFATRSLRLKALYAPKRKERRRTAPPDADVTVHRVRCVDTVSGLYEVRFRVGISKLRTDRVQVKSRSRAVARVEALGVFVRRHKGESIVLPALHGLTGLLIPRDWGDGDPRVDSPSNVPLGKAQENLTSGHEWNLSSCGNWLVGDIHNASEQHFYRATPKEKTSATR